MRALVCLLYFLSSPLGAKAPSPPAYWIWAGITPSANLSKDTLLYVYQGELSQRKGPITHRKLGLAPYSLAQDIVLVYRASFPLPDPEDILRVFHAARLHWEKHKVHVAGLQLDVDVPTKRLSAYAGALKAIRARLGPAFMLSVTGLGDWTLPPALQGLKQIASSTDEMVIQLYQERRMHQDHALFTQRLCKSGLPFKVGVLANVPYKTYLETIGKCAGFRGVLFFVQREGTTP